MEIGSERRNGYAWYGTWGEKVAAHYARWSKQWPERSSRPPKAE
jgi:hypothetical protein